MGFARGFIKGFIGQAIDTKVAEDERLAKFNEKIADLYLQEKRPAFVKNEENINRRNTLIKNEFGNNAMLKTVQELVHQMGYLFLLFLHPYFILMLFLIVYIFFLRILLIYNPIDILNHRNLLVIVS